MKIESEIVKIWKRLFKDSIKDFNMIRFIFEVQNLLHNLITGDHNGRRRITWGVL